MYDLLVPRKGRCSTVRQQQFTGTFSEEVYPVVGSNPNVGGNPQNINAEGVFLNCD